MARIDPAESELLAPVLRLFPKREYKRFAEAELGRKRIDLLCVPRRSEDESVSVELKVRDWKKALWQASHNFHVAEQSYVAIWHRYLPAVERNRTLFETYGVGIIVVRGRSAVIHAKSCDLVHRIARDHKAAFYKGLIGDV